MCSVEYELCFPWVLPAGSPQLYVPLNKIKGHPHLVSHTMLPCHGVATLCLFPLSGEATLTPGSQRARAHAWSVLCSRRLMEIPQPRTVRVVVIGCFPQITTNLVAYNDTNLLTTLPVSQKANHKGVGAPAVSLQAVMQVGGCNLSSREAFSKRLNWSGQTHLQRSSF